MTKHATPEEERKRLDWNTVLTTRFLFHGFQNRACKYFQLPHQLIQAVITGEGFRDLMEAKKET